MHLNLEEGSKLGEENLCFLGGQKEFRTRHSANGCRESYGSGESVATPNFNSLITGARATSCRRSNISNYCVRKPLGLGLALQGEATLPCSCFSLLTLSHSLLSLLLYLLYSSCQRPTFLPNVPETLAESRVECRTKKGVKAGNSKTQESSESLLPGNHYR